MKWEGKEQLSFQFLICSFFFFLLSPPPSPLLRGTADSLYLFCLKRVAWAEAKCTISRYPEEMGHACATGERHACVSIPLIESCPLGDVESWTSSTQRQRKVRNQCFASKSLILGDSTVVGFYQTLNYLATCVKDHPTMLITLRPKQADNCPWNEVLLPKSLGSIGATHHPLTHDTSPLNTLRPYPPNLTIQPGKGPITTNLREFARVPHLSGAISLRITGT